MKGNKNIYDNATIKAIIAGGAAVCGIGISNLPLIDFLLGLGKDIRVTARDRKDREALGELAGRLKARGVSLRLGDDYLGELDEAVIFRTPGLRPDTPALAAAARRGGLITSEMELFLELTPATLIGVTGSDGKTTTTTLTYKMLEEAFSGHDRRVYVGGNIGRPLLPMLGGMSEGDIAVLELSSFQLQSMRVSPEISTITNITPNHLDWHTGMEEYREAKLNICSRPGAVRLSVNAECAATYEIGRASPLEVTFFSSVRQGYDNIVPAGKKGARAIFERDGYIVTSDGKSEERMLRVSDILLPGRHNVENYMAAIANVYGFVSIDAIVRVAKSFPGVEHRLEFVREIDGVKYYNSSIDSSPTRTSAALTALPVKPVVICGGYDKKIPFSPLSEALIKGASGVVLTGATAGKIYDSLLGNPAFNPADLPVVLVSDFEGAVSGARAMAKPGGIVLLSPGCASFDRFSNFMERGEFFKRIVRSLAPLE